jgi:hypothetical protein
VQVVTSTAVVLYNYTGTANGDFSWVASGGLDYDVTVSFS